MNRETLYSIKPDFTSGDDQPSLVANDSLNLLDSQQGRRKPNRLHNHRKNARRIAWNDETKQVEIQDDPLNQIAPHKRSNDKNLQQSPMINSQSLVNRLENNSKYSMPPIIKTNRSKTHIVAKKPFTVANSASINDFNLNEDNDELTMKLYEETKKLIDQLNGKINRLEKGVNHRDQIIEKLNTSQDSEQSFDKREKQLYEQRISDLEEELQKINVIKSENMRLKEENAALIRVISKISK